MADLSPATQAALKAAIGVAESPDAEAIVAAALRALADHKAAMWDGQGPMDHWHPDWRIRRELHHIADQLEGTHA